MLELCVIFGGQSPEHEISRKSVTSVLNNLNKDKYHISTIGITRKARAKAVKYSLASIGAKSKAFARKGI